MLSKSGAPVKSDAEETGPIRLCIRGRMADQLRALARDSGASSVGKWYVAPPEHHTALHEWDVVA